MGNLLINIFVFQFDALTDSFSEEDDDDFQIADDHAGNHNDNEFNQDEMRNLHIDGNDAENKYYLKKVHIFVRPFYFAIFFSNR